MIHPLAATTPCKFAVVSLAAKEKINKYMERNLLWICKHWFARSSGFLFNCSAYTSARTHTKWGCEFMVRKQGGTHRPSVYCCLIFTFRDALPVYLPASFAYLFFSSIAPVSSLHSGRDFGSCLSLWVTLFISGISLPSARQKWSPSDLYLVPGLWEREREPMATCKRAHRFLRKRVFPLCVLESQPSLYSSRRSPAQRKVDILPRTCGVPVRPPLPFSK